MLTLPIFLGRPRIVPAGTVQWTVPAEIQLHLHKKRVKPQLDSLCSRYLSSRAVTRQVLSAYMSLTSVFGMGTGGPS